jgi:hypothetical protein
LLRCCCSRRWQSPGIGSSGTDTPAALLLPKISRRKASSKAAPAKVDDHLVVLHTLSTLHRTQNRSKGNERTGRRDSALAADSFFVVSATEGASATVSESLRGDLARSYRYPTPTPNTFASGFGAAADAIDEIATRQLHAIRSASPMLAPRYLPEAATF